MKKVTLNESDLLNIVNKVLNEQELRQFDEDKIDLLHLIFERELKPPFRKGEKDDYGEYTYYNRDDKEIGWLNSEEDFSIKDFSIKYDPIWTNIQDKVCQVFEFPQNTLDWWYEIRPYLNSWLENQINAEINMV